MSPYEASRLSKAPAAPKHARETKTSTSLHILQGTRNFWLRCTLFVD